MLLSAGKIQKTLGTGGGGGVYVVNKLNMDPDDCVVQLVVVEAFDSKSFPDNGLNLPKLKPVP